jgi:DNA-binding Lrp family transcriptional regulator
MAIKAYVLIVTDPGKTKLVFEQIHGLQGIQEVHEVMGPYDIVVEITAESLQDIPRVLGEKIRPIEGVQSTTSLVTFPEPRPSGRRIGV